MEDRMKFIGYMLTILITIFALSGCASKIMQSYVGQDVRKVMLTYGKPSNAFNMGNGKRAFQWNKHKTYVTPTYTNTSGYLSRYGSYATYNAYTRTTGGQVIHSSCVYTLFAKWSTKRNAWIVTGFQKPKLSCE